MTRPGGNSKGGNIHEEKPRIWDSICLSHAVTLIPLQRYELKLEQERRNLEVSEYIIGAYNDPRFISFLAEDIIREMTRLALRHAEERLRKIGTEYIKAMLEPVKNEGFQPSSGKEFEIRLGTWTMGVFNTILASRSIGREAFKDKVKRLSLDAGGFTFLDIMYIGWTLHRWAFRAFFTSLPAETFSTSSVKRAIKELLTHEARLYPELNEALKVLD
jgi:hypothetical protein